MQKNGFLQGSTYPQSDKSKILGLFGERRSFTRCALSDDVRTFRANQCFDVPALSAAGHCPASGSAARSARTDRPTAPPGSSPPETLLAWSCSCTAQSRSSSPVSSAVGVSSSGCTLTTMPVETERELNQSLFRFVIRNDLRNREDAAHKTLKECRTLTLL
jgi:hypothetical protein